MWMLEISITCYPVLRNRIDEKARKTGTASFETVPA
jgi:hypothetical protein